jgi:hypothetical protein
MSVRVMSAVWELDLPASEKLVLLALADCANDEGLCWPSMSTIAKKCSKSDRTVQTSIKALADAGHLTRHEVLGRGCSYHIHPRHPGADGLSLPPPKKLRGSSQKAYRNNDLSGTPEKSSPPISGTPEVIAGVGAKSAENNGLRSTPEDSSPPKNLPLTPEEFSGNPSRTINTPLTPHSGSDRPPLTGRSDPPGASDGGPKPGPDIAVGGRSVASMLARRLEPAVWRRWIEPLSLELGADELRVAAPSAFVRDWVRDNFDGDLRSAARAVAGHPLEVVYRVDASRPEG